MVTVGWGALIAVFMVVFVDFMQLSFLFPLFPDIVKVFYNDGGSHVQMVGLLCAISSLAEGFASPYLGGLADKFGRRPVFIGAISGCILTSVLTGLTPLLHGTAWKYWSLFVIRGIAGVFGGTAGVAAAYIADVTAPEERAQYMTYFQAALFAGLSIGPVIGTTINQFAGFPAVCYSSAGICVLNLLFVIFLMPESKSMEERQVLNAVGDGPKPRMPAQAYIVFFANFFNGIGFTALESLGEIFIADMFFGGLTPSGGDGVGATSFWGLTIAGLGVVGLIVNLFLYNRLMPCMGLKGSIAFGGFFCVISFLFLGIPISKWWFFAWVQVFVFGQNMMGTGVQTIITRVVHPSMFGKALGMMTLYQNIARGVGPLILPWFYTQDWGHLGKVQWAFSTPFFMNCFFKALATVMCLSVRYIVEVPEPGQNEDDLKASIMTQTSQSSDMLGAMLGQAPSSSFMTGGLAQLMANPANMVNPVTVVSDGEIQRAKSAAGNLDSEVGVSLTPLTNPVRGTSY